MSRPTSKMDLLDVAEENFEKLWETIDSLTKEEFHTEFDFSSYEKKKEAHWGRDKKTINSIESFSNEELFTKKYFPWTGTTSLGSYMVSATSSHFDWAIKKIKAHKKIIGKKSDNN